MMLFKSSLLVMIFGTILALGSAEPEYVVESVKLTCENQPCGLSENKIEWRYGKSGRSGKLEVTYQPNGQFSLTVSGGGGQLETKVFLGNTIPRCEFSGTTSATSGNRDFSTCGFTQEIKDDQVYRTNTLTVRHHFGSGPVRVIGYRKIDISFTLKLVQPKDECLTCTPPPKRQCVENCTIYNHELIPFAIPDLENCYGVYVQPLGYNPSLTGIGFKLEKCVLHYRLKSGGYSNLISSSPQSVTIIDMGVPLKQKWFIGWRVQSGKKYTFQVLRRFPANNINFDGSQNHKIECSVCLCSMQPGAGGLPVCPSDEEWICPNCELPNFKKNLVQKSKFFDENEEE